MPASQITGTPARSTIIPRLCSLRMPCPVPIGAASGMTAAQPMSSNRFASAGSSFVYGSTVNPSSTSCSAASTSSRASGSNVLSSAITSSLTQDVPSASRASRAVSTASRAVRHPAVFGRASMPSSWSRPSTPVPPPASTRRMATVVSTVPDARNASPSTA